MCRKGQAVELSYDHKHLAARCCMVSFGIENHGATELWRYTQLWHMFDSDRSCGARELFSWSQILVANKCHSLLPTIVNGRYHKAARAIRKIYRSKPVWIKNYTLPILAFSLDSQIRSQTIQCTYSDMFLCLRLLQTMVISRTKRMLLTCCNTFEDFPISSCSFAKKTAKNLRKAIFWFDVQGPVPRRKRRGSKLLVDGWRFVAFVNLVYFLFMYFFSAEIQPIFCLSTFFLQLWSICFV